MIHAQRFTKAKQHSANRKQGSLASRKYCPAPKSTLIFYFGISEIFFYEIKKSLDTQYTIVAVLKGLGHWISKLSRDDNFCWSGHLLCHSLHVPST